MKWGLVSKPSEYSYSVGKDIYKLLGRGTTLEHKLASQIATEGYSLSEMNSLVDAFITIGGDGTILMTLQHTAKPVFPINTGRFGFLTEVEAPQAQQAIKQLRAGHFTVEERIKLTVRLGKKKLPNAANDIAIHVANLGKILPIRMFVNKTLTQSIYGDGLIVATPMGSTSHALSVGGPIVDPALNAYVVAPIAPFRHAASAMVIPSDKKLKIRIERPANLVIDGLYIHEFLPEESLEIYEASERAQFITLQNNFYRKIYRKMNFHYSKRL